MSPSFALTGSCQRLVALVALVVLALVILIGAGSASAESRLWTDRSGQTMNAEFVRETGSDVIFKRGTRMMRIPFTNLSEADQEFIKSTQGGNGVRFWMVNGRKLRGAFKSYSEGSVRIRVEGDDRTLPLDVLSKEDREHLRRLLKDDGKFGDLPETDPLKVSDMKVHPTEQPSETNVPDSQEDEGGTSFEHEPRTWTDSKGRTVEATFVRMDAGKVVLRRTKDGKEMGIPMPKLAAPDRLAAVKAMSFERRASRGNSGGGSPPVGGLAAQRAPSPPRNPLAQNPLAGVPSNPSNRPHDAMVAAQERFREQREQGERMQREAEERRLASEQRTQEQLEQRRREEEELRRERDEQRRKWEEELASNSSPGSGYQSSSSHSQTMVDQFVCSSCGKDVPGHLGAGDHCSHCNAFFEYEESAYGQREYAPISERVNVRGVKGIAKLAIFALIIVGGWISRMFKRS